MRFNQKLAKIALSGTLILGLTNRLEGMVYDDFSSGNLNPIKWEVRQDTEGQPLMDEGFVTNGAFHTQQNSEGDRRTYLFPKKTFKAGEIFEYDIDYKSGSGNRSSMALLTGDGNYRIGLVGYWNGPVAFDEFGVTHAKFSFSPTNLTITRTSPSGTIYQDSLPLSNPDGIYNLQVGSACGHNGMIHMDYDNFKLNIPEPSIFYMMGLACLRLLGLRKKE